jgi:hypothetical protein
VIPSPPATGVVLGDFDWSTAVGKIDHHVLPGHDRGGWNAFAAIPPNGVLSALFPTTPLPDTERSNYVSELARIDLDDGSVKTLVRLPPGKNVFSPVVRGTTAAWVETDALDMRAHGWKLHLTDLATGADRLVVSDPGERLEGTSLLPAIGFDGSAVFFTALTTAEGGAKWELRRWDDGRVDTIAALGDPHIQRFLNVAVDERSVAWIEQLAGQEIRFTVAVYDLASGRTSRQSLDQRGAVYTVALAGERVFLGTDFGVFETDRSASIEPKKVSAESSPVDTLAVAGNYLIYRNFDPAESLVAIDLRSGARAVLATGVTTGPRYTDGLVIWFERPSGPGLGRVGATRVE